MGIWVGFLGVFITVMGFARLISGNLFEAAADAGQFNNLISGIMIGVGVCFIVVSYLLKGKSEEPKA